MEASERDSTREWLLPEDSRPPLLSELVERIDEALATARASEAAVMTVGAAAIEAAEQAKRAAELAERASATMAGRPSAAPSPAPEAGPAPAPEPGAAEDEDDGLRDFSARADRIAERLRRLERSPLRRIDLRGRSSRLAE
jgi:predicted pyridoxine 5'-phosphate oxidase superfamily flavin-nucleotide-binding protein